MPWAVITYGGAWKGQMTTAQSWRTTLPWSSTAGNYEMVNCCQDEMLSPVPGELKTSPMEYYSDMDAGCFETRWMAKKIHSTVGWIKENDLKIDDPSATKKADDAL